MGRTSQRVCLWARTRAVRVRLSSVRALATISAAVRGLQQ